MPSTIYGIAKKNNDELYTPNIIIIPILKYFDIWKEKFIRNNKRNPIVLCPFDTKDSEFVLSFQKYNDIELKYGHINNGQDFFTYDYGNFDIVISNPPFSQKLKIFKRLDELNKPWCMIINTMILNYHEIIDYFIENGTPEILFLNKKVSYDGNPSSFISSYLCRNFLPQLIVCENVPHNNNGHKCIKSKMYNELLNNIYTDTLYT